MLTIEFICDTSDSIQVILYKGREKCLNSCISKLNWEF